jgi:hypothetical protein
MVSCLLPQRRVLIIADEESEDVVLSVRTAECILFHPLDMAERRPQFSITDSCVPVATTHPNPSQTSMRP